MSRPASDMLNELAARDHDYVWARLPFLVPMAAKIARACGGRGPACGRLARRVDQLHSLTLRHLDREERLLARLGANGDDGRVLDQLAEMSAEHCQLLDLLTRVCLLAGLPAAPARDACPTVHAFHEELRLLDQHLRNQIHLEDKILASRVNSAKVEHHV